MNLRFYLRVLAIFVALSVCAAVSSASELVSALPGTTLFEIGSVPTISSNYVYQGLAFNGEYLMLSGGDPSLEHQVDIYQVPVVRGNTGYITGFGDPSLFASLNVVNEGVLGSGGLMMSGPNVVFTTNSAQFIGAYNFMNPQFTFSDQLSLGGPGDVLGGLGWAPGFVLKMSTQEGYWYNLTLNTSSNPLGVSVDPQANVMVPAYSFSYMQANDLLFPGVSVIVGDTVGNTIKRYTLDLYGNPTGMGTTLVSMGQGSTTIPGFGMVRDPVTGALLFTASDHKIYELYVGSPGDISLTPEPATMGITGAALGLLVWLKGRRPGSRQRA
jgi:hypothetical protein